MLDWAAGRQNGLARIGGWLRRSSAGTAKDQAVVASLSPRGRLIFEEMQKAISALPNVDNHGGSARLRR
jgi:hypothetical protein